MMESRQTPSIHAKEEAELDARVIATRGRSLLDPRALRPHVALFLPPAAAVYA